MARAQPRGHRRVPGQRRSLRWPLGRQPDDPADHHRGPVRQGPYLTGDLHHRRRLVLVASRAGDDRHPDWYHNLVANPDVFVELGSERFEAQATVTTEPERTRLLEARVAEMPRFGDYAQLTERTIPVVVLERR